MGLALHASRFGQAVQKFNMWDAELPHGETFESCLNPAYWAHVASKLRIGDEIRLTNEDGTLYARLFIMQCDRLWAKVAVIEKIDLSMNSLPATPDLDYTLETGWAGRHDKFRVYRTRGGVREVLSAKHETKDAALRWMAEHMRTIKASKVRERPAAADAATETEVAA